VLFFSSSWFCLLWVTLMDPPNWCYDCKLVDPDPPPNICDIPLPINELRILLYKRYKILKLDYGFVKEFVDDWVVLIFEPWLDEGYAEAEYDGYYTLPFARYIFILLFLFKML